MRISGLTGGGRATIALIAAGGLAYGVAACAGPKGTPMDNPLSHCEIRSATLHLVGEQVMTRAAITAETIERHAPPIAIAPGDKRLATLTGLLHRLTLEPSDLPRFDLRLLVKIDCVGGASHILAGSRTWPDGRLDLGIDGTAASTHSPLRKALEALAEG